MTQLNFQLKPCFNNILIQLHVKKQIAVGDKPLIGSYGKVMAIGEDVKKVKVGDIIIVRLWGIIDVDVDGMVYHFVPEDPKFIISGIDNFQYE